MVGGVQNRQPPVIDASSIDEGSSAACGTPLSYIAVAVYRNLSLGAFPINEERKDPELGRVPLSVIDPACEPITTHWIQVTAFQLHPLGFERAMLSTTSERGNGHTFGEPKGGKTLKVYDLAVVSITDRMTGPANILRNQVPSKYRIRQGGP